MCRNEPPKRKKKNVGLFLPHIKVIVQNACAYRKCKVENMEAKCWRHTLSAPHKHDRWSLEWVGPLSADRQTGTLQGPIWQVGGKGKYNAEPKTTSFTTQRSGGFLRRRHILQLLQNRPFHNFQLAGSTDSHYYLPHTSRKSRPSELQGSDALLCDTDGVLFSYGALNCVRLCSVKTQYVSLNTQI